MRAYIVLLLAVCSSILSAHAAYLQAVYTDIESTPPFAYGKTTGLDGVTQLDLFLVPHVPLDNPATDKPAIIMLHGYGENVGASNVFAGHFAQLGYVAFDVGWAPLTGFQDAHPLNSAKSAVRWVRAHAQDYGIDPDKIAVYGYSYGAYLATLIAVSDDSVAPPVQEGQDPNYPAVSARVKAVVEMSGFVGGEISYFDKDDAPILIMHGTADAQVNFNNAATIRERCRQTDIPYAYCPFAGLGHQRSTMMNTAVDGRIGYDWIAEFLAQYLLDGELDAQAVTLFAPCDGKGSVTRTPEYSLYAKGATVSLTATPAPGYRFLYWDGGVQGTASSVDAVLMTSTPVTPVFVLEDEPLYPVTVATIIGKGTVTLGPTGGMYPAGATVTLYPEPAAGWEFDHWSQEVADANPGEILVNGPRNITAAYFRPIGSPSAADINRDTYADILDVQIVINAALRLAIPHDCDLNGDGLIDALDVQLVINGALRMW